jgi:DNA-binding Xre family transcriptional regulator
MLMTTRWRLAEIMARHQIRNKDLLEALGSNRPSTISDWKRSRQMPRIDGPTLDKIAAALSTLSNPPTVIRGVDLIEDQED